MHYFYPRPPRGGRHSEAWSHAESAAISIHALREEGDRRENRPVRKREGISIHALREEGDCGVSPPHPRRREFLSTPSARRATACAHKALQQLEISIHALREEGDWHHHGHRPDRMVISIHALREEGDLAGRHHRGTERRISIHALREEGDCKATDEPAKERLFLSTPSARRATSSCGTQRLPDTNFYPRPPRGGRPRTRHRRALRSAFLSTPSARRATPSCQSLSWFS